MTPNGSAIQAIRKAQKLSIRALSDASGLNRGHLSRIENGHVRTSRAGTVERIAQAMRVPTSAITHQETT